MGGLKLPDELENILIQAAESVDNAYWTIGDITADIIDEVTGVDRPWSKTDARTYVARLTRLAPETVRDLERMSRKIPEKKRIYNLSRHQYRACLAAGDEWETYAARAEKSADEYAGLTAPVAVIRGWIKNDGKEQLPWVRQWDRWAQIAESLLEMANKNNDENFNGLPPQLVFLCAKVSAFYDARDEWVGYTTQAEATVE